MPTFIKTLLNQLQISSHIALKNLTESEIEETFKELEIHVRQLEPNGKEMKDLANDMPSIRQESFRLPLGTKAAIKSIIKVVQQHPYEEFKALLPPQKRRRLDESQSPQNPNISSSDEENQVEADVIAQYANLSAPGTLGTKKQYRSVKHLLLNGNLDVAKEWKERLLDMIRNCVDLNFNKPIELELIKTEHSEQVRMSGCFCLKRVEKSFLSVLES